MILWCTLALLGADTATLLEQGNLAADQGRYDEAVEIYSELLHVDPEATGAWLNLGNSAYRGGSLGKAIAAFRVAATKAPRDPRVASNLELARSDVKDRVEPPRAPAVIRALFFWHYVLSAAELGWLVIALSPLLSGIAFWLRRSSSTPWGVWIGAALVLGLFVSWSVRTWSPRRVAVVGRDDTQVRTGTDQRSDVRFLVNEGSELRWRERAGSWVRVALPNGQQGWVHEDDVIVLEL